LIEEYSHECQPHPNPLLKKEREYSFQFHRNMT
jgi:hypothetical protein